LPDTRAEIPAPDAPPAQTGNLIGAFVGKCRTTQQGFWPNTYTIWDSLAMRQQLKRFEKAIREIAEINKASTFGRDLPWYRLDENMAIQGSARCGGLAIRPRTLERIKSTRASL
jgi:hypothetical protein